MRRECPQLHAAVIVEQQRCSCGCESPVCHQWPFRNDNIRSIFFGELMLCVSVEERETVQFEIACRLVCAAQPHRISDNLPSSDCFNIITSAKDCDSLIDRLLQSCSAIGKSCLDDRISPQDVAATSAVGCVKTDAHHLASPRRPKSGV